jgi:hypothetical protein
MHLHLLDKSWRIAMKSSSRSPSLYIALLSVALSAAVGTAAHAADHLGDAQVQARELLTPVQVSQLTHSTQPAGVNRAAGSIIDVQEQARCLILGTPSAVTANAVDTIRSSQHGFVHAGGARTYADAQVMARQLILGVRVDQSSKADRASAALGSP